jgi:pyrroloquinoline quinone biosynthesis protein B
MVRREALSLGEKIALRGPDGEASGLLLEAFAVPGKVALYMEDAAKGAGFGTEEGDTIGLEITDEAESARVLFVANCARVDEPVRARCAGASLLLFDGTLWRDEEMISRGEGRKTGQRMGHVSMSGKAGSMAALAGLDIGQRVFIHINNTNPALLADSPERAEIEAAGWAVAYDGMEIALP